MAENLYFSFAFQSICRNSVSYNLPISNRVTPSGHFISAVSFYCINGSIYHAFHNPYVINTSIISPVEENKISRGGNIAAIHELAPALKPFHACRT